MKSKCCNSPLLHQNGSVFCSNCIRLVKEQKTTDHKKYMWVILIVFILLFLASKATAPTNKRITYNLINTEYVDQKDYAIDHLVISLIESNNQSNLVSVTGAFGNMQLMPVTLKDWNQLHPKEQYTIAQATKIAVNTKIGRWMLEKRIPQILKAKNIPVTINHVLIGYNWGVGGVVDWYNNGARYKDLPEETQQYICKYWAKF